MADVHFFNVDIAKEYGVHCAVVFQHIWHWVKKNEANDTNYYDGKYWTYNSIKAFGDLFPYLSRKQIETALKKLRDEGLIETGNYNVVRYDRTLWYAVTDKGRSIILYGENRIPNNVESISSVGEIENTNLGNRIPSEVEPIPYINTNINTDRNTDRNTNNKRRNTSPTIYYPHDLRLDAAFADYVEMRKQIKKPMTSKAIDLAMKKLEELSKGDNDIAVQILDQSVLNSWQGLFPLKEEKQQTKKVDDFMDMWRNA